MVHKRSKEIEVIDKFDKQNCFQSSLLYSQTFLPSSYTKRLSLPLLNTLFTKTLENT